MFNQSVEKIVIQNTQRKRNNDKYLEYLKQISKNNIIYYEDNKGIFISRAKCFGLVLNIRLFTNKYFLYRKHGKIIT